MLSNYVKNKLTEKIKIHLEMAGKSPDVNINHLIHQVKDYGKYEIVWDNDFTKPIGLFKINDNSRIEVNGGKYFILNNNGSYIKILYSSQFIDFSIIESRDERLNKLLKNKI